MSEVHQIVRDASPERVWKIPEVLDKYFWDHTQGASDAFKLKRLFEYAGFPDLIKIPFSYVKENLHLVDLRRLRTSEKRIDFLLRMKVEAGDCESWDEAIYKIAGIPFPGVVKH